jgi:predicted RNA-binding protein
LQCIERERGIYYNALREKEREGGMHYNAEKERKEHFIIDCERDFRHPQVPKYLQHVFKPNKRYRKPKR